MSPLIRLLIADDHAVMREGLRQLFAITPDIEVAAEATAGDQILARLEPGGISLLLIDMSMPGVCGEELIASIRARHPKLPILVLSMHNEAQIARGALQAGADGYITKDQDPETLLAAIRAVAAGGRFIDPRLGEGDEPGAGPNSRPAR